MIETPDGNLTKGMRHLNGVFTHSLNGPTVATNAAAISFQGRYKAILVDRDSYFLELARYIVFNPVRVAMVKQLCDSGRDETGAYSYQQIAKGFGVHFTTVGRIVRLPMKRVRVTR